MKSKKVVPKKNSVRDWVMGTMVLLAIASCLTFTSYIGSKMALHDYSKAQAENMVSNDNLVTEKNRAGSCVSDTFRDMVGVYMMPERSQGILGAYVPHSRAIVLYSRDVDTIAHEVSHYVDAVVQDHGINDGETRAYLQGYFTKCVYDMVHKK